MPRYFVMTLVVAAACSAALAGETPKPSAQQLHFFETNIRPVLIKNCYKCHSTDSKKLKGGLKLDTRAALLKADPKFIGHGRVSASEDKPGLWAPPFHHGSPVAYEIGKLRAWSRAGRRCQPCAVGGEFRLSGFR